LSGHFGWTRENFEGTGENRELTGENRELTGENLHMTRENLQPTRENLSPSPLEIHSSLSASPGCSLAKMLSWYCSYGKPSASYSSSWLDQGASPYSEYDQPPPSPAALF